MPLNQHLRMIALFRFCLRPPEGTNGPIWFWFSFLRPDARRGWEPERELSAGFSGIGTPGMPEIFCNSRACAPSSWRMIKPLAIVAYEKLLPGTQLVNRLQDLGYRVETLADITKLTATAEASRPMVVVADLGDSSERVLQSISHLRQNAATSHLPVVAFSKEPLASREGPASKAGVTLLVSDTAILNHLAQCLERALQLD